MSTTPKSLAEIIGRIQFQCEDCHSPQAAMARLERIAELVREAEQALILQQLEMSFKMVTQPKEPK